MATYNQFEFDKIVAEMNKAKVDLPKLIASDIRNYFVTSFKKQSFDGEAWKNVKRREHPKTARDRKPILIQSGRLRRAVNESIRKTSWQEIVLGIDVPYAKYQNDGTEKIPQRKFMGDSKELQDKIYKRIDREMKKILKKK